MAWKVEGDDAVLDWLASEPDADLRDHVLKWIPEWAEDPESFPAMPVPNERANNYVTFVPESNVGVKFLAAVQFNVLRILKMRTVTDL